MINSEEEIWKSHPDIAGIEVSTFGRVRTLDRTVPRKNGTYHTKGIVLKQWDSGDSYLRVCITIDGKQVKKLAHRLVAQTFIPNPNNLPQVNHKDCNRINNCVSNLEWVTHEENIAYREKYGTPTKESVPKSPAYAINLSTLEVSHFNSQHEASRALGISVGNINSVIKGRYKHTGGFWFVNDDGHAVDVVKSKLHDIGKTGLKIYN